MFHSNIDRLLVSIEKLFESRQPGAFNDELLTLGASYWVNLVRRWLPR